MDVVQTQARQAKVTVWNQVSYSPGARRRRSDGRVTQIEFPHTDLAGIEGAEVELTWPNGGHLVARVLEHRPRVDERSYGFCGTIIVLDRPAIPDLRNVQVELAWRC